jgi:hypothetical protein
MPHPVRLSQSLGIFVLDLSDPQSGGQLSGGSLLTARRQETHHIWLRPEAAPPGFPRGLMRALDSADVIGRSALNNFAGLEHFHEEPNA